MNKVYADLHIHSPFSLATSKSMTPEVLEKYAVMKGINILATGDIFHPEWQKILKKLLIDRNNGFFRVKNGKTDFVLSGEVSLVFGEKGKKKKVHILILCKDFKETKILTSIFSSYGKLASNGRPFLKMSLRKLSDTVKDETENCYLIPAHIWTPHYSIFGSKSGFDSLNEAFEGEPDRVIAMETGLSSDPPMNWLVKDAMRFNLVSNSDSHSPMKIGREANVFEDVRSYDELINSIRTGESFLYTLEFFPEEGKYFYDGHRKCGVSFHPIETEKHNGLCPVCNRKLTIGVLNRVYQLSKKVGKYEGDKRSYKYILPLTELISEILGKRESSSLVQKEYERIIKIFGSELRFYEDVPISAIEEKAGEKMAAAIERLRRGDVKRIPGYDGEYGRILFWS